MDNLNRATTIGGVSRTYDLLGNTTAIGTKTMNWDALNRMTSYLPGGGNPMRSYAYRADGMRVRKGQPTNPGIYTDYAYDGQMPVEEYNYQAAYPSFNTIKVIRYGLGARGIDRIERVPAQGATLVGYPVYDDHGNMIATLMRSGSNQCTLNDRRSYDAWGGVRTGNATGEPHGRYCANLGHLADDESGFTYMRARYYEPGAGRFVSQDRTRSGLNWFTYCGADPINQVDEDGHSANWESAWRLLCLAGAGALIANALFAATNAAAAWSPAMVMGSYMQCLEAIVVLGVGLAITDGPLTNKPIAAIMALAGATFGWLAKSVTAAAIGGKTMARAVVVACMAYSLVLAGFLLSDVFDDAWGGR